MRQTPNYDLNLFDSTDEIEDDSRVAFNDNFETLDTTLNTMQGEIDGLSTPAASSVTYDNTDSGLTATNVQDAVDEISTKLDNNTTVKEQIIAGYLYAHAVGKVVTINGWVGSLTLPAGTQTNIGTLNADIPKPTAVIRAVCNCGANAYSAGEQGYFGIDTSGNVFVTPKSSGHTTIYVSCSYIGA